jgi:aspartyl/asparaginyl beta-hydroxylase (cupin superfamily)
MQTQGIATVVWLSEALLPPSKQAIYATDFPWAKDLRDNWETIRQEYIHFQTHHYVTSVTEVYPNFDNLNENNT